MDAVLRFLIAVILGGAVGAGSALYVLRGDVRLGAVDAGGWRTSIAAGSADAGPYTRAVVAARGLLALTSAEAIYYTRDVDSDGAPLREACAYRVSGQSLPGRWWSLTAYATDDFLPQNADNALSYGSAQAGEGAWSVVVAPARSAQGPWISSAAAGDGFSLMLRVYQPERALLAAPEILPAPRIEALDCDGAPS